MKKVKREAPSAARPKVSGKTALFPRNDRPYGLKRKAFQTEIAPEDVPAFADAVLDAVREGVIAPATAGQLMDAAKLKTAAESQARITREFCEQGVTNDFF